MGIGKFEDERPFNDGAVRDRLRTLEIDRDHFRTKAFQIGEKHATLLMAVSSKFEGETRHDTALRYIKTQDCGQSGFFLAAQNCINAIDDYLEYRYKVCGHDAQQVRDEVLGILAVYTKKISGGEMPADQNGMAKSRLGSG